MGWKKTPFDIQVKVPGTGADVIQKILQVESNHIIVVQQWTGHYDPTQSFNVSLCVKINGSYYAFMSAQDGTPSTLPDLESPKYLTEGQELYAVWHTSVNGYVADLLVSGWESALLVEAET